MELFIKQPICGLDGSGSVGTISGLLWT